MSTTKENQVDRRTSSVAKLAVTALLIGIAAIGCGKGNGAGAGTGQPNATAPAAVSSQADTSAATPTVTDTGSAIPSSSAGASVAPGASAAPIDGDLSSLDQLINGLNGSLSGADAGSSGGE